MIKTDKDVIMPRKGRIDYPGALHHVMARGIECRRIFSDDHDRNQFLQRLGHYLIESKTHCYAWALMSNHVHFLIETAETPLSKWMHGLLTSYASYFNKRHQRPGRLFQNRFKSILCESDRYLLELIRYIHLNPLRAGMLKNLDALHAYPWTGHSVMNNRVVHAWFDTTNVLSLFSSSKNHALSNYIDYMREGVSKQSDVDLSGGGVIRSVGGRQVYQKIKAEHQEIKGDQRILGSDDFVQTILDKYQISQESKPVCKFSYSNDCLEYVATQFNVNEADILLKSRQIEVVKARAACAALLADELQYPLNSIADFLNINTVTASRIKSKGRKYLIDLD